jgi:Gylcosyl hydrolase family 115 C-terminal domain
MRQMTPALHYVQTLEPGLQGDLGVAAESRLGSVPGDDQYHSLGSNTLVLPQYSTFSPPRWIDIFSTGLSDITWTINTEPFVKVSQRTGGLSSAGNSTDVRVYITIDWSLRPPPSGISMINITSSSLDGSHSTPSIALPYNNTHASYTPRNQFVEADGHIAFEAWSYPGLSKPGQVSSPPNGKIPADVYLMPIPNYGVTLAPFNTTVLTFTSAPFLSIPFESFSPPGNAFITLHFAPSLNTDPAHPMRYALSLDASAPPREVQLVHDRTGGELPLGWGEAVARERWESRTEWQIAPGEHSLVIALLDVGLVLKRVVVDFGGVRESGLGPPTTVWIGR